MTLDLWQQLLRESRISSTWLLYGLFNTQDSLCCAIATGGLRELVLEP